MANESFSKEGSQRKAESLDSGIDQSYAEVHHHTLLIVQHFVVDDKVNFKHVRVIGDGARYTHAPPLVMEIRWFNLK